MVTCPAPDVESRIFEALRYLAEQCAGRPLIHDLVIRDLYRWDRLSPMDRRFAFRRAHRRVGAVCPWTLTRSCVLVALTELDLQ